MTQAREVDPQRAALYLRHMREGGAKIAQFLVEHPGIDPCFIEEMTEAQEAELNEYTSDLTVTQQIELAELRTA
ncbi:hypothetical protein BST11_13940 [Mycobacterium alsense]|uniref:Uncharacterized protein n=1 Tax=Mycobacterium alsense TaxID=324058 RepID=A0AA42BWF0_9MYCO|nr:hypothetical protein [Mycobacterium alsense]MCV7377320.1 hypothetical protein [Mycobacterium alsense]OQZ90204.1 hypothetical protein BST11_13940 [Mycobacterium alsense]